MNETVLGIVSFLSENAPELSSAFQTYANSAELAKQEAKRKEEELARTKQMQDIAIFLVFILLIFIFIKFFNN